MTQEGHHKFSTGNFAVACLVTEWLYPDENNTTAHMFLGAVLAGFRVAGLRGELQRKLHQTEALLVCEAFKILCRGLLHCLQ